MKLFCHLKCIKVKNHSIEDKALSVFYWSSQAWSQSRAIWSSSHNRGILVFLNPVYEILLKESLHNKMWTQYYQEIQLTMGLKSTSCSFKGPGFGFNQPHKSSHPPGIPAPRALKPWGLFRHQEYIWSTYIHAGNTFIHIKGNFKCLLK